MSLYFSCVVCMCSRTFLGRLYNVAHFMLLIVEGVRASFSLLCPNAKQMAALCREKNGPAETLLTRQQAERMDGWHCVKTERDRRIHRCHGPRLGFREGDPIMDGRMEESIAEFLCRYWQAVKVAEAGTVRD